MNPFVWVLIAPNGDAEDVLPDSIPKDLDDAWKIFDERLGFACVDAGYRVLRCKLVEVGPA